MAGSLLVSSLAAAGAAVSAASVAGAATFPATCRFDGQSLDLVTGVTAGSKVAISCSGLSPLHPYLLLETSLLLGIDPKASSLLSGNIVSLSGLDAALAALPEINLGSPATVLSGLDGSLNYSYRVPSTQAIDPNATCPQTSQQFNSGLIGCGLAMIDLTSFKPVGAGSALLQYKGEPELPPAPTLTLSAQVVTGGQKVTVSDHPGATTYWWLSTLSSLEGLLGGGTAAPPKVTVTLRSPKSTVAAANTISVLPAVYNKPTLTPPKLEGGFTVPTGVRGKVTVTVTYGQTLLSIPLSISATASLKVKK